ncbi:Maltose/maltodextrin import ATP-binding protein MalK [Pseudobythopirellula maris]|uniref:Maltose/maltodextrin import ATP-binding protein MalK n=1 Tax=Pseudobythopirellula maris TaxID=2527991 RepID=A0A5C5ZR98_9BACT|nr:molybdenum ABC transporter ATP-binding protein [Pseudobythopirellula maris]TWT89810.1 Maltose/maltodextrin import ATP-binding protein MalK [Pseudobythopirellula maris]
MSTLSFRGQVRYASGATVDVAFDAEGGVTALFGPSGSGKSSVVAVIAGLLRPNNGLVRLGDETLVDTSRGVCLPPERRRVGLVSQDHLLFPHMTAEANLRYGMRRAGPAPTIGFEQACAVLDLTELLGRRPAELSGGERQRVAIGRALLSQPRLLLLDEPLASLDAARKGRVLACLERIVAEWNTPTVLVSHDQAEVRRLADRVVVLDEGRVIATGAPDEALAAAGPLSWRDETGPMNLLRLEGVTQCDGAWTARVAMQELALPPLPAPPDGPLYARFPPHEVTVAPPGDVGVLSARNRLRGVVRRTVEVGGAVFVAVELSADAETSLWAEVTPQSAATLGLAPGAAVQCLVKTSSLRVGS